MADTDPVHAMCFIVCVLMCMRVNLHLEPSTASIYQMSGKNQRNQRNPFCSCSSSEW